MVGAQTQHAQPGPVAAACTSSHRRQSSTQTGNKGLRSGWVGCAPTDAFGMPPFPAHLLICCAEHACHRASCASCCICQVHAGVLGIVRLLESQAEGEKGRGRGGGGVVVGGGIRVSSSSHHGNSHSGGSGERQWWQQQRCAMATRNAGPRCVSTRHDALLLC